ncbi:acetylornithine deacetylase [Roseivivax sediminis]|uniref:Acetylornithine deacetylase n=1 Tax=Roseivivax sediminis TaxID=936889 RepID=A0A1I1TAU0_9RHOB|nr:acetylornithine deacetylase [Roseivivax sediminis]SFD55744.1 acetylornithine deacetylase [Roseivivax sediminis]
MTDDSATAILADLVGFDSVVGTPNGAIMDYVAERMDRVALSCHRMTGPEGDRENLFATIGDPCRPGYILSAHVDVVPATEPDWQGDPFRLRRDGDRLIGRGACDMKGFVAAILAALPDLAAMHLSTPIHIALSYDEEAGCRGVPHMIAALPSLCAPPLGCIVGEPTGLAPVLAHKGKAAVAIRATGRAGHSSRPDLGVNAIHRLAPVLASVVSRAASLEKGPTDTRFAPPWSSLQAGIIAGGQAINIVPDRAEVLIEARAISGVDPEEVLEPVIAAADSCEVEWLSRYPALALPADAPLAALAERLAGRSPIGAVSFGTEAGLYQEAGVPAIVCGPGDIARAHRPEEYLRVDELEAATAMIRALGRGLAE